MAKRHPSLILLSQDHHHGLALALRLRQGDTALLNDGWTHDRGEQAKRVQHFYESELRPHFKAEEEVLFPILQQQLPSSSALVETLLGQHREMEQLVRDIAVARDEIRDRSLVTLGMVLEKHIRSEERELFELMQNHLPEAVLDGLGGDVERIRHAS
jgi:hemerythrin-like domain-containing protein